MSERRARAGPASKEGYVVENGSLFTPRELYVLRLEGGHRCVSGSARFGSLHSKIGLEASPDMRRQAFQKAMPRGAFQWQIERTAKGGGMACYTSHAIAVKGEDVIKRNLAKNAEWLGGEFYLTPQDVINAAWHRGCKATQDGIGCPEPRKAATALLA